MKEIAKEDLEGLTLEEAVRFLTPRGWKVIVHRYEDGEYTIDDIAKTYHIDIKDEKFNFTDPTISLDIQDGKVYEFTVHIPEGKFFHWHERLL